MSMTDPIADLLTRIRNAHMAKHDRLDVPASKIRAEISALLKQEGYIEDFQVLESEPSDTLRIFLRYTRDGSPVIRRMQRVSKPGRRVYRGAAEIEPVLNGLGTGIISTSHGILTDREAREKRVGGEVLCEIW
ncbi:MAG: 30S ribosomal protein S8 [Thermoanaerobaculia bacterium]|nr:30S ribosomal protein S8 [Thermoanaerobaculia bacterium]